MANAPNLDLVVSRPGGSRVVRDYLANEEAAAPVEALVAVVPQSPAKAGASAAALTTSRAMRFFMIRPPLTPRLDRKVRTDRLEITPSVPRQGHRQRRTSFTG